jgi:hypothetical protein
MNFSKMKIKTIGFTLALGFCAVFSTNAQNVEIKHVPEVVETEVGETFTVNLAVNYNGNSVSVLDMFLNYDPQYLEVQNIEIVQEEQYNFHIPPAFNNETGKIKMSAFKLDDSVSEEEFSFVEIEFLALAETEFTYVGHEENAFPSTMLAYAGAKVNADMNNLMVSITGADPLSDGILTEDEYTLDLWPNPATDYAIITMKLPVDERIKITLYDSSGRLIRSVFEGSISSSTTNHFDLDLEDLADGMYAVEFLLGNQIHTEKLIVTR